MRRHEDGVRRLPARSHTASGLRVATAANPAMPGGGLAGESKREILEPPSPRLPERVARTLFVPPDARVSARAAVVRGFVRDEGLALPVVLKPDVGERGRCVGILRSDAAIELWLAEHPEPLLAQEHLEPTQMYDPRHGLRDAQRVVREAVAHGVRDRRREPRDLWRRARAVERGA